MFKTDFITIVPMKTHQGNYVLHVGGFPKLKELSQKLHDANVMGLNVKIKATHWIFIPNIY